MMKSKKDVYYYSDTTRIFIKKGVGEGRFNGFYLWQEVKKILCFYIPIKEPFWLDDYSFTKTKPKHKK